MFYLLNSMIEPCKSHTWCCIKIGVVWFWFEKELLIPVLFIYLGLVLKSVFEFLQPLILAIFTKNLKPVQLKIKSSFIFITHN
jgi:hypothetical protein